jgi:hypothetical protein
VAATTVQAFSHAVKIVKKADALQVADETGSHTLRLAQVSPIPGFYYALFRAT